MSEEEEEDLRLKAENEARISEGESLKVDKHERACLKVEEGFRLALELRRRKVGEQHEPLKAEEEARLVEEARLKSEEEDLRMKSKDEARLVEEARLNSDKEEQARLKTEKEPCLFN